MELLQLTYFCHAAQCENFSKTAKHFQVPTSNISRAVRYLETELGVKLFNRSANKIVLSEEGNRFLTHAKRALYELELGKNEAMHIGSAPSGEIKLLISSCRRIVTQAIEACKKQYPDIRFSVKHGVDNEEYDFIISDAPPSDKSLDKYKLMSERLLLAIPPVSSLYSKKDPTVGLENESFISLGSGTRLHAMTEHLCASLGFVPRIEVQIDDPLYVRKYLEMGLGVAFFPEISWATLSPIGVRLADIGAPMRHTYVFFENSKLSLPANKVFLEILKSAFKKAAEEK